jgi:ureidoglycolate lyase
MSEQILLHDIAAAPSTFSPFGQVIEPGEDGTPFGPSDAQLVLKNGTPRLYIMRLKSRGLAFDRITRHVRVTQCLAAIGGGEWLLAVAPPLAPDDGAAMPDPAAIRAFRISGPVGIKLHRGTWHAGPFFTAPEMDFLNLELADTNETDHVDCHLGRDHGVTFRFDT